MSAFADGQKDVVADDLAAARALLSACQSARLDVLAAQSVADFEEPYARLIKHLREFDALVRRSYRRAFEAVDGVYPCDRLGARWDAELYEPHTRLLVLRDIAQGRCEERVFPWSEVLLSAMRRLGISYREQGRGRDGRYDIVLVGDAARLGELVTGGR